MRSLSWSNIQARLTHTASVRVASQSYAPRRTTVTPIPSTTPLHSTVKTDSNPFRYNVHNPEDAVNSLRDEVVVYQQPKHPTTPNKPPSTVHVTPSNKDRVKADNSPDLRITIDHEETNLTQLFSSKPKVSKSCTSSLVTDAYSRFLYNEQSGDKPLDPIQNAHMILSRRRGIGPRGTSRILKIVAGSVRSNSKKDA